MDATPERVDRTPRWHDPARPRDVGETVGWLAARARDEDGKAVKWTVDDARRLCWVRYLVESGRVSDG